MYKGKINKVLHLKCQYRHNFDFLIWSDISCSELLWKKFSIWIKSYFLSNISKMSARVSSGLQARETFETTRTQAEWFYCFRAVGNLMKPEARVFEITFPTMKIILNYHLNKFSQFNYYIWDVICAWSYHLIAALWQFLNTAVSTKVVLQKRKSYATMPSCIMGQ